MELAASGPNGSSKAGHDLVVVGASMGGVEALQRLAAGLPADLAAAVLVVQHTAPESPGLMGEILDRAGPLPAALAEDGERVAPGTIRVAPPDRHLLVHDGRLRVARGPRENRARPAIDPLFRTAALAYGSRVVGVVLTGLLNDGAAGLRAVKRCGGLTVVQAPADAAYPDMPRHALARVDADHTVALAELGALLGRLVATPAPAPPPVPDDLRVEQRIFEGAMNEIQVADALGPRSPFTCPECGGTLWELHDGAIRRYRCHTGHAYTAEALLHDQDHGVEAALYAALRAMEEQAEMLRTMAHDEERGGRAAMAARFGARAVASGQHAERLRTLLLREA